MSYELHIPLKRATLEIEFDTMDELASKLAKLDAARIDKLVGDALRRKAPAKRAAKKAGRRA